MDENDTSSNDAVIVFLFSFMNISYFNKSGKLFDARGLMYMET